MYDCRCLVTGVSLKGMDAVLVPLLQGDDGAWRPIALGIKGNYDRLGAVDGIDEDEHTAAVARFFEARLADGRLAVRKPLPNAKLESLLRAFERNINDHPKTAVLDGKPVKFSLICRPVWDAAARGTPRLADPSGESLDRLLPGERTRGIYAEVAEAVAGEAAELAAVAGFLAARKIAWAPTESDGQHYREEVTEYLAEARKAFADEPRILAALKTYESESPDLGK
jgi:hypothetical protein